MHDITLRTIIRSDAEVIANLLRATGWFSSLQNADDALLYDRVATHIDLANGDLSHTVLVAEHTTQGVVGYIAVHWLPTLFLAGPEGYVSELFVANEFRGQGIGSQLLDAIAKRARDRGCYRLMLINSRHRDSYQRQFYIKAGWQERENVANFVLTL